MVFYEGVTYDGADPMFWVRPGTNAPSMGFRVSQAVFDYVKEHGFAQVAYHRKTMQRQIDAIAAALPTPVGPAGGSLQIGDIVRVGAGKVPWRVQDISKITGTARLSSTSSAIQRSELVTNLKPFPQVVAESTSAAASAAAAAVTKVSRSVPGGPTAFGGVVVGALTLAGVGVVAARRQVARRRALTAGAKLAVVEELVADQLVSDVPDAR